MELKKFKLSDIGEIVGGATPLTSDAENYNGDISWITPNDLSSNTSVYIEKGEKSITEKGLNSIGGRLLPIGTVLFSSRAPIGYVAIAKKELCTNQGFKSIVPNLDKVDAGYLYYLLKQSKDFIAKKGGGTTFAEVSRATMEKIELYFPSLEDQHIISNVLLSIDEKIEICEKINQELESTLKDIYDYWFVQFDFPNEEGKPYKSSGGEMVWNEKLKREIPNNWKVVSLLEIAEFTNGIACQNYPPIDECKLHVIKIKEMHEGYSNDTEYVNEQIPKNIIINNGDILFSWSASLEVMMWANGIGALNQHIFKVTSKNNYPKSFYYMQLQQYLNVFKKIANARKTTMGHITQDHLKQSRIVIPSDIAIVYEFDKLVSPLLDKIVNNTIQINALKELRDFLLPMLMNGQIKIKD